MLRTFTYTLLAGAALSVPALAGDGCGSKTKITSWGDDCSGTKVAKTDGGCSASKATLTSATVGHEDIVTTAVEAGSFKTLAAALQAAGLVEALQGDGPFTVFAPTDDAFAKLPEGTIAELLKPENKSTLTTILTYHVVAGSVPAEKVVKLKSADTLSGQRAAVEVSEAGVKIAGVQVVKTDIQCSNGIIHVIDAVMMPATENIVGVAANAGSFNTLIAAAKAAGLAEALMGEGPFTVFAPTDDAFAKLPEATITALLKPENRKQLAKILEYHVVSGRVFSTEAVKLSSADTLAGEAFSLEVRDGKLFANDSQIVAADVQASNGVVHVIDSVLMPPSGIRLAAVQQGRKVIGVYLDEVDGALAAQLDVQPGQSLLVSKVVDGGNAAAAGLQRFDVITSVDGHPATEANLASAKEHRAIGESVDLVVLRKGTEYRVHVPVGVERH